MVIIKLIDNGTSRYEISSQSKVLGRRWDNNAESFVVERPQSEFGHSCTMVITYDDIVIDHINVGEDPIFVTSNLSQYDKVKVSFSFFGNDGYLKNSNIETFYFLEARKPEDFTPVEPEKNGQFEALLGLSFTDVNLKEGTTNTYEFRNMAGAVIKEITIVGAGGGSGSGGGTTNYNDLANKPSINGVELSGNKTTEELGIVSKETDPTVPQYVKDIKESDIENWNNKVDNTVDNLVNYYLKKDTYSKDEVNQLISAIRSLKKEIVETLPTDNIDENTIYLVPKTSGSGNDYYDEYLYINGNFEFIGSTQIDLTDYVKNTDFATNTIAGIVKVNPNDGIGIGNTSKALFISPANQTEIYGKTSTRKPIVPETLDYAVKVGMTTNTEEWTNEEKEKARNLIGVPKITATQIGENEYSLTIDAEV